MICVELLDDLYAHMEWADSKMWQAVLASTEAAADPSIKKRLFHIHHAQQSFLKAWRKEEIKRLKVDAFETMADLQQWVRPYYTNLQSFMDQLDNAQLETPLPLPWASFFGRQLGREVEVTTLGETMFQVASHSVHHRAQINLQLREHGAAPPLIDFIAWIWSGRPAPVWGE